MSIGSRELQAFGRGSYCEETGLTIEKTAP